MPANNSFVVWNGCKFKTDWVGYSLRLLALLFMLLQPAALHAQFNITTNGGTITISGYTGSGGAVTIPGTTNGLPVTRIGRYAFHYKSIVTSVIIPNSVTNIGELAFGDCSGLTNVTMPNSLLSIGDAAFYGCSLARVSIPSSVTSIGWSAFMGCQYLTDIAIPSGITSITPSLFNSCYNLTNVSIPTSVTNIGDYAFQTCYRLPNISIPTNVVSIGISAFSGCRGLTNVVIPHGVVSLASGAFESCSGLTNATIPNSVRSIGHASFRYCSGLPGIFIPDSVTNIGIYAFVGCTNMASITVNPQNPFYCSVDGCLLDKNQTTFFQHPSGKSGSATIPAGVSLIYSFAFNNCKGLTGVSIPPSVKAMGESVFIGCHGLTNVVIPSSVTNIGWIAFAGCLNLKEINVEPDSAFFASVDGVLYNKSLSSLIQCPGGKVGNLSVPDSIRAIGLYAFYRCTNLTSIQIPAGVTTIDISAFSQCSNLKGVYFRGNAPVAASCVFCSGSVATVYYLPGKTGWGSAFDGRPTMLWKPLLQASDGSFGVMTNQFGFNISWASNMLVIVESATNLTSPVWSPLQTNTLAADSMYFSDSKWTNYPVRFYRIRRP